MKIGNYDLGNNEKSTRKIAKHALAANVDELPPIEIGVSRFIKSTHEFKDQKVEKEPVELKIIKENDLGSSGL